MGTFFTSDLHLGHANIIGYCGRPFDDVDAMDAALVATWNSTVSDDDEVWVLGDFALGDTYKALAIVGRLRGSKHLVVGNHDRPFRDRSWHGPYFSAGFASIHHGWVPLHVAGHDVLACHFPYSADPRGGDRFAQHRPPDEGLVLLHGHVHGRWRKRGREVDIGVDAWGGRLVGENDIAALLASSDDAAPLAWVG